MSIAIAAVTVLEDRAAITRRGTVAVTAGQQRIVIDRVSPVLADKTLTATAANATVGILDIRCERYVAPWRETGSIASPTNAGRAALPEGVRSSIERPAELAAQRAALATRRDDAVVRAALSRAEIDASGELTVAALADLAVAATRGQAVTGAAAKLAEFDADAATASSRAIDADVEAADLAAAIERLDARIASAEAEAGEQAARIVIDLVADKPGEVPLSVGYVVPGAAWRPYHRAILVRDKATLDWQTTACVWQATGEDWIDAELTFSLDRPSLGIEPPDLADDLLRARRRPDSVAVEAREVEIHTTGLGPSQVPGPRMEGGGPAPPPGIDDGGLGVRLAGGRVTVRCDGMPHRIAAGSFSSQVQLSLVAMPLVSPWVHLRARAVNTGSAPILAGPVDLIMTSGYVGRAEIGLVATGEKFHVGFGPEADVRVHRVETRERDDAGILGGWNVQTVRVAVRLSNLGATKRDIVVSERVPISEVEQVEVSVAAADAYLLDQEVTQVTARALDDRGLVSWSVELPPSGRRAVTLEYKIKSQRNVAGV